MTLFDSRRILFLTAPTKLDVFVGSSGVDLKSSLSIGEPRMTCGWPSTARCSRSSIKNCSKAASSLLSFKQSAAFSQTQRQVGWTWLSLDAPVEMAICTNFNATTFFEAQRRTVCRLNLLAFDMFETPSLHSRLVLPSCLPQWSHQSVQLKPLWLSCC